MLSDKNLDILVNIIGACESGGQVYGQRKYDTFANPYHISSEEHTITIGWACNQGSNAKKLMQMIFDYSPEEFRKYDMAGIEKKLSASWYGWTPSKSEREAIIALLVSPMGKKAQDDLFKEDMKRFVDDCENTFTTDPKAVMMYCEIRHLGGKSAAERIFRRTAGWTTSNILASLKQDQYDTRSDNQVGDKLYWSRHEKCAEFIETYVTERKETMTAKDVTICGHGSGNPSLKNMYTYSASRYAQRASNGVRKGIVAVRRLKKLTDEGRKKFVESYNIILGRNVYSQSLREYVYKVYAKTGRYYSDCSSSICATFDRIGFSCPLFNTAAIYQNNTYFETVPVTIKDGQIQNPEVLKVGDCILYAGNDPSRPLQIGHVEAVYSFGVALEEKDTVKDFQNFLNKNYADIVKQCAGALLEVDGAYGKRTRSGALGVWKYMSNKYYGTNLTIRNDNFFGACKEAAEKMTEEEVKKHPTLAYILQGILAGRGLYKGEFDAVIGSGSKAAIKELTGSERINSDMWYKLFN